MSEENHVPPPVPPTPPPPPEPSSSTPYEKPASGGSSNTVMLVLAYFGILALVPYLVEKDDADVRWHAKNGLVMFIAEFIGLVALAIVFAILGFIPVVNAIAGILGCVLYPCIGIGLLVLHVMAIMKAVKGERMIIPYVTEYAERL